jgi:hypothetical protein
MKTSSLRIYLAPAAMTFFLRMRATFGQTPGTGAISGIVYDPANSVVANAQVCATNDATGVSRAVMTTPAGVFRVPLLVPGTYTLVVNAGGFATSTSRSIQVTVSQTSSVNVTLAVAGTKASVEVSGKPEIADMESSTLGGLVDQTAIQVLPLSNHNYTQILGLSPGVVVDLPNASSLGSGTQNVASDGAAPTSNNIQFNGIDADNLSENSAANAETDAGTAIPAPDTIQEFRVQTANFDAAYGRGTGANVDLMSKNGANKFHGSAWEFVRNNSDVGFIRSPGQHTLDTAVERRFPVRESTSFRLRAEFFNLTNTPQFGNPSTSLGYSDPTLLNPSASPTFGKITGTVTNPRMIQFAAKFQVRPTKRNENAVRREKRC